MQSPRIAVVGAGLGGAACARDLCAGGARVQIFDKSRGMGGRMATRRGEGSSFDHGAQYFTARSADFTREVDSWLEAGIAAPWEGRVVSLREGKAKATSAATRFVGQPHMSSIARALVEDVPKQLAFECGEILRESGVLNLRSRSGESVAGFDAVVLAMPAPQVARLSAAIAPEFAARAARSVFDPCWAVMLEFDRCLPTNFDGAFVEESPLAWVARNSSKPARPSNECWVLHASPLWSLEHRDTEPEAVIAALTSAFVRAVSRDLPRVRNASAHRWLFARPCSAAGAGCLLDASGQLGACGDWCLAPRVEGAFVSGREMARRLLEGKS